MRAGSGVLKAVGLQDIETGDGPFDEAYIVQAPDRELALRYLTDQVRGKLLALRDRCPVISLGKEGHEYREPTVPSDGAAFDPIIDAGLALFDLFTAPRCDSTV